MKRILMVYASMSGNTEIITDIIANQLRVLGYEIEIKSFDFDVIHIEDFNHYEAVVVGTYTWDDGQLPYEVEDFYIDLEEAPIQDKVFAVYGSADSCYDTYGRAIDLVAEQAEKFGAYVLQERLKIDLSPDKNDEQRCLQFAQQIANQISSSKRVNIKLT